MAVFPLLYTAGFLSFLYFGIYIYAQKKKDRTYRLFLAFCLCFAFWNLSYAAMTVSREEYHQFFQKLGYLGAGWYAPFLLLFFLRITGFRAALDQNRRLSQLVSISIFIFPLVLSYENLLFNRIVDNFPDGFWYIAHQLCANIYNGVSILLLALWMRRTESVREKRQALLIIVGSVFTIILTVVTDFMMGAAGMPTLTPFLTLIWGGCIFYAFSRFNFMKTSPHFMSTEILAQSPDISIMFDRELRLLYSNRNLLINEETPGDEQFRPGITDIFEGGELLIDRISSVTTQRQRVLSLPVVLNTGSEKKIYLHGSFSLIADDLDSFGGVLFTGRESLSIEGFCRTWNLSSRETEVLGLIASGRSNRDIAGILGITERTVKNHVSNMMYKTKTGSRMEIVQLLRSHTE